MKVIYIAGPFRAASAWEIEQNIRRAETAALEVWRLGCACICPHTNTRFFHGAADDSVWLEGDLEILRRCDAVLLVGEYWESAGTRRELDLANEHGIPVFESLDSLGEWVRDEL